MHNESRWKLDGSSETLNFKTIHNFDDRENRIIAIV